MTEGTEWQLRAKAAGLSQKTLADILDMSVMGVSKGIRGRWDSGVPRYMQAVICAWEIMTPGQRDELRRMLGVE